MLKRIKLLAVLLIIMCFIPCFSAHAWTGGGNNFGVVDLSKVVDNYTEAQKLTAELKVKESELQNFLMEAQQKIKDAKTPLEKKNLEEKLGEEFNIKRKAFIQEQSEKWEVIENNIFGEIETFSKDKRFEMVFNKQSVIIGGEDITDELIKKLNQKTKK